jgi:hypothetical protein
VCMFGASDGENCVDVRLIGFYLEAGGSKLLGNGYICLHPRIF